MVIFTYVRISKNHGSVQVNVYVNCFSLCQIFMDIRYIRTDNSVKLFFDFSHCTLIFVFEKVFRQQLNETTLR